MSAQPKPVTLNTPRDQTEEREHTRTDGPSSVGRTVVYIDCPFCHTEVKAYLWSLSGGGKRCPGCGAKHNAYGTTRGWREASDG